MDWLAPYALPGIIGVSAIAALVAFGLALRRSSGSETDEPLEASNRRFVMHLGQASAAVCFGAIAGLAAIAALAPAPVTHAPPAPPPRLSSTDDDTGLAMLARQLAAEVVRLRGELRLVQDQPRQQASPGGVHPGAGESLPQTTATSGAPIDGTIHPRDPAARNARSVVPSPPLTLRQAADARVREWSAGFSLERTRDRLSATVAGVRVELATGQSTRATGGAAHTLRLIDSAGQPLKGASITLRGLAADGTTVEIPLDPVEVPGAYRSRSSTTEPLRELRLRVVLPDRRFELPLGHEASRFAQADR
jgi:hypothetical protein